MDLVLNLETWDTKKNATAVVRAGALVDFYPATGMVNRRLLIDARQSVDSQIEKGRSINQNTIDFWLKQVPTFSNGMSNYNIDVTAQNLDELVLHVIKYIECVQYNYIWTRGHFDYPILMSLFKTANISFQPAFKFNQFRDVSTLDSVTSKIDPEVPHNPLSHCIAQIKQIKKAYLKSHTSIYEL